jgi:hypothetical protein
LRGFQNLGIRYFLGNHLRERKYEVQRFESQMVVLGSFEYQIFEENHRREEERERERDAKL